MVDGATLQKILQDEADFLNNMVELEEETQAILVRCDANLLEQITRRKEKLIGGLADLEQQRREFFSEETTLQEYISVAAPQNRRELTEIRKVILNLHKSLQKRLEINRYLLNHNLQFARRAVNTIFPNARDDVYASRGEKKEEQARFPAGLLDSNA